MIKRTMRFLYLMLWYGISIAQCPRNYFFHNQTCLPCEEHLQSQGANASSCKHRTEFCPVHRMHTPKLCTLCPKGLWSKFPCNRTHDTKCALCTPCTWEEKLVKQCSQYTDTVCVNCDNYTSDTLVNTIYVSKCRWLCKDGFFNKSNTQNNSWQCSQCPENHFCSTQYSKPQPCPAKTKSLLQSTTYLDCQCPMGTFGLVLNATHAICEPCPLNMWCPMHKCENGVLGAQVVF